MPCYRPIDAWQYKGPVLVNRNGVPYQDQPGPKLVFRKPGWKGYEALQVPCGRCIGCRLERSRQWAVRISYESLFHDRNVFLTLTYNDECLPKGRTLIKSHHQKFMKRLRLTLDEPIKFFHCGEYGSKTQRPHYHDCVFNLDFDDKQLYTEYELPNFPQEEPIRLYTSETLNKLWGLGNCYIGDVTFESAAYCARYVCDKITGDLAVSHYGKRLPEYQTQSQGLSRRFFDEYDGDIYPHDFVLSRGVPAKPPRYFDKLLERRDPDLMEEIKERRAMRAQMSVDNTPRRLADREEIQLRRFQLLRRILP